ncbi:hypothetical protein AVE30378_02157 [Achromobacter veterisilvae]|uniref:Uncharacterized protein n=1 Tax=Achromobacter veterisilvae TaxID=2069367 RepID=A0A446CFK8_9BURK|nr:hypothetical protein [Achromobacter veterisilvae]SSW66618.1 hypothetical protein AVE30378_02157 [Achromobacter veterisilvae]
MAKAEKGLSIREFARREGCSDTLVRRAITQGRLKAKKDGTLDPALIGSPWRQANATASKPDAKPARPASSRRSAGSQGSEKSAPGDVDSLEAEASRLLSEDDGVDYAEALRRKENWLALLRQMEYEQKSGALVEFAVAQAVLFEAFRGQRDAWLNWPAKIGPLLAAELGLEEADRVTEALTAHVHKQISELGEPAADFSPG